MKITIIPVAAGLAATSSYSRSATGEAAPGAAADPSKSMRSDEKLLTGDVAAKVTAAAKGKEPTATIERVETDSDGVYEAHMVRSDGTHIIVQIDKTYAVTAVQAGGQGGPSGSGGSGGPGGAGAPTQPGGSSATPSSATT